MWLVAISIISYLLGSIPFSYFVAKAYGKNLYEIGSGNIGGANVYRATGKVEALLLAVIGDVGKGVLAIYLSQRLAFLGYNLFSAQALAAFFVVMGHNWPLYLKFKGGRGLASLIGVVLVLNWKIIPLALGVVILIIILTELIMKKGLRLAGSLKEKLKNLFSIIIEQVAGRMIGILLAVILVYLLYPGEFKIAIGAVILAGIKHIKRTQDFLKKPI